MEFNLSIILTSSLNYLKKKKFKAFGVGANDLANTFGSSVGAKVLTLKQAYILASVFEIFGFIILGSRRVSIVIYNPELFVNNEFELILGYISIMISSFIWLSIATWFGLPVSATQTIVGSTIGMAVVSKGYKIIKWLEIMKLFCTWFISPLLSGILSIIMFFFFIINYSKLINNKISTTY